MAKILKKQKTIDAIITIEKSAIVDTTEVTGIENLIKSPTRYFYDLVISKDGKIEKLQKWQMIKDVDIKK